MLHTWVNRHWRRGLLQCSVQLHRRKLSATWEGGRVRPRVQSDDTLDGDIQDIQRVRGIVRQEIGRGIHPDEDLLHRGMQGDQLLLHRFQQQARHQVLLHRALERQGQGKRHGERTITSQTHLKALCDEIWGFKDHCFIDNSTAELFQYCSQQLRILDEYVIGHCDVH